MKKIFELTLSVICFYCCSFALVANNALVYNVKVPLTSNAFDREKIAQADAFRQLITKVTGNSQLQKDLSNEDIYKIVDRFLSQISFTSVPIDKSSEFSKPMGEGLEIGFDKNLVIQYIKEQKLPIWSSNRPQLIVIPLMQLWTGNVRILESYKDSIYLKRLEYCIESRGVPFTILTDQSSSQYQFDVNQLWDLKISYAVEQINRPNQMIALMRFLVAQDGTTIGSSLWSYRGVETLVNATGNSFLQSSCEITNEFFDSFSKKFQFTSDLEQLNTIDLAVTNIQNYNDYLFAFQKISSLEMVQKVHLERLKKGSDKLLELFVQVDIDSQENAFIDAVSRMAFFQLNDIQADNILKAKQSIANQQFRYYFQYIK